VQSTRPLLPASFPTDWLPDENLFSLVSRYHRLSSNHLSSRTTQILFGHQRSGAAHDLPSRIDAFVRLTGSSLGDAKSIVLERTVLPFYLPFLDHASAVHAIRSLRGNSIGSLKFRLGLLTSSFRANHPLKACQDCIADDVRNHHVAYWHWQHQLPGVWVCGTHNRPLSEADLKSNGVGRFLWVLPDECSFLDAWHSAWPIPQLHSLAQASIGLATLAPDNHLNLSRITSLFRERLHEFGLLQGSAPGRLRQDISGKQYHAFLEPFRRVPELTGLPDSPTAAAREIARISAEWRTGIHPLRVLGCLLWLSGSWEDFLRRYQTNDQSDASQSTSSSEPACCTNDVHGNPIRERFTELLEGGHAVSMAAKLAGCEIATGQAWAAQAGMATASRASKMRGDLRVKMIRALRLGRPKVAVAQIADVSVHSVTRLLRTVAGLQAAWHQAQHDRACRSARGRWLRAASANPLSGVKAVRFLEPAAYAWLYRNDRDWLNREAGLMAKADPHGGPSVDWDSRDRELADAVMKVSEAIAIELHGTRIKLWQLYQRIPDLRAKLGKLDRLPLTQRAIRVALGKSSIGVGTSLF